MNIFQYMIGYLDSLTLSNILKINKTILIYCRYIGNEVILVKALSIIKIKKPMVDISV